MLFTHLRSPHLRALLLPLLFPLVPLRAQTAAAPAASPAPARPVQLNWLGGQAPAVSGGTSWGVPWPRGTVSKEQTFTLRTGDAKSLPLQAWPLAYWPDGSVKWTGFSTVAGPQQSGPFTLSPAAPGTVPAAIDGAPVLRVRRSDVTYEVDTGRLRCRIPGFGHVLFRSMSIDGREVAGPAQLVTILQQGPDVDATHAPAREEFIGNVERVTMEQSGPVRAVFKFEGRHRSVTSGREWLPFVVRLYFHAGESTVRMVHSIVYDGEQHRDFIRGLGLRFTVPLREQIHNRHRRFAGENDGVWAEPVEPMIGRYGRVAAAPGTNEDLYPKQVTGERVPNREELADAGQDNLADWAVWGDARLAQLSPEGFTIEKRTNRHAAWIPSAKGRRASGAVFVGDASGGLGVSVKDFWQSYPKSLEVREANSPAATLTAWLWSPEGPAMDLRYYDTIGHGSSSSYEGSSPASASPMGIGRTHELTLFATDRAPNRAEFAAMARSGREPPLIVCTPEYLHAVRAFGLWSLPDRSTPFKRAVEERIDSVLAYYQRAVDVHGWYGFWDYGDVIHSYDADRHAWRYDIGGMAWHNSELATDMWLWLAFVRSGRPDLFRMAEAMTRHTGEVDSFHLGPYAGLGTRHNVRHWGLSAKEARVSQAGYRRYHYYLTTDERTGDVMRSMLKASDAMLEFDAMRTVQPATPAEKAIAPTRVRFGPDWLSLVSNWMTEWERTNDPKWRDLITAGMDSIAKMSFGIRSGRNLVMGYDPKTGRLFELDANPGTYNLATIMGGAEVVFELNEFLEHPEWQRMWVQYLRLYSAPREVLLHDRQTGNEGADARFAIPNQAGPRLAAYVYYRERHPAFADFAIRELVRRGVGPLPTRRLEPPEVLSAFDEAPRMNTNYAGQAGLDAIVTLELCRDRLPVEVPAMQGTLYDRF